MKQLLTLTAALFLMTLACAALVSTPGCDDLTRQQTSNFRDVPDEELKASIDKVLEFTERRHMNTKDHAAWQIIHGIVGFQDGLMIEHEGKLVSALDYILDGGTLNGFTLRPTQTGLDALVEPGSKTGQGHPDQWLGYMSLAGVEWDDPIVWNGKTYKFGDLASEAQLNVREGKEMSWTLAGLVSFPQQIPLDGTWKNNDPQEKEPWSIERVLASEAKQDLSQAACGGFHALTFMQMAMLRFYEEHPGVEPTGGWAAARQVVSDTVQTIKSLQNSDGSFSTNWIFRPGASADAETGLNRTGHQLEFLTYALEDPELSEAWVERAIVHVCELLETTKGGSVDCGALYHAAHALQRYRARRWGVDSFQPSAAGSAPAQAANGN